MTRTWTYAEVCDALLSPDGDSGDSREWTLHVGTSGSTGSPKIARLRARALQASAQSTLDVLGGPGQWLLATPATHIAGIQVLVRSVLAGIEPVVMAEGPFTPERFAEAATQLAHERRYTSLVPTQVGRLLDSAAGRESLAGLSAVLVGGAAVPQTLKDRAREADITLVATYGMSETAGGCVYDGVPLPVSGMRVTGQDELGVGVIELTGPTLADGYVGQPQLTAAAFRTDPDGSRWFRTDDLGRIDDGVLSVLGRRDDVINTGGLKVAPHLVEDAVRQRLPDLGEVVVVATPDPTWGEAVTLVVVGPSPAVEEIRAALRDHLPAHALPTRVAAVQSIPRLGPGKPDRRALREQVSRTGDR